MSTISSQTSQTGQTDRGRDSHNTSLSELKQDLANVKDDLGRLRKDAMGYAASAADSVATGAKHQAENAMHTARNGYKEACRFVSERPATSVLVAFGLGAIAGRLLSPRR